MEEMRCVIRGTVLVLGCMCLTGCLAWGAGKDKDVGDIAKTVNPKIEEVGEKIQKAKLAGEKIIKETEEKLVQAKEAVVSSTTEAPKEGSKFGKIKKIVSRLAKRIFSSENREKFKTAVINVFSWIRDKFRIGASKMAGMFRKKSDDAGKEESPSSEAKETKEDVAAESNE